MYLSESLSGEAMVSFITVSDSTKNNVLNYSPTLKFTITFGEGNVGWQFP